jgi:hypothetical protein
MKLIITLAVIFSMVCIYPTISNIFGFYILFPWIIVTILLVYGARKLFNEILDN